MRLVVVLMKLVQGIHNVTVKVKNTFRFYELSLVISVYIGNIIVR